MMRCFYDIHIHSCLSGCADDLMTLHNIINMSKLKGLDIIAITDHNSAKNCKAFMEVANNTDLLVIPAMELETYEGIHMLCYFRSLKDLMIFEKIVYKNLPNIKNNNRIFGKQIILDKNDCEIGYEHRMLHNSCHIKLPELINLVHLFKGIVIPAHIDRKSNSIISILGFIPEQIKVDALEISKNSKLCDYNNHNSYNKYRIIQNSDAHYIEDICEKVNYLDLKTKTIDGFFACFGEGL